MHFPQVAGRWKMPLGSIHLLGIKPHLLMFPFLGVSAKRRALVDETYSKAFDPY